jgi:hypothetical protein
MVVKDIKLHSRKILFPHSHLITGVNFIVIHCVMLKNFAHKKVHNGQVSLSA